MYFIDENYNIILN